MFWMDLSKREANFDLDGERISRYVRVKLARLKLHKLYCIDIYDIIYIYIII